jgi:hypothetical protein
MNCDSFSRLLYEVPLPLWTPVQQTSAEEHCLSCKNCELLLQQQQQLFTAFDKMVLPEPATAVQLQLEPPAQQASLWSVGVLRRLSYAIALFLCAGSAVQLFRESGFSWYWITDGRRLESVSILLYNTPLLSVALTIMGLVYCLALNTQATPGDHT